MIYINKKILYLMLGSIQLLNACSSDEWIIATGKRRKSFIHASSSITNSLIPAEPHKHIGLSAPPEHATYTNKDVASKPIYQKNYVISPPCSSDTITFGNKLQLAAFANDVERIEKLIAQGADICALDSTGATALHWAAGKGKIDAIKTLLQYERGIACIGIQDNKGKTPLHRAAGINSDAILILLTHTPKKYIDLRDNVGSTALLWAASGGREPAVRALLQKGADPNIQDDLKKRTALHWALRMRKESIPKEGRLMAKHTSYKIIQHLCEKNPNLNIKDSEGYTPLYWAQQLKLHKEIKLFTNT